MQYDRDGKRAGKRSLHDRLPCCNRAGKKIPARLLSFLSDVSLCKHGAQLTALLKALPQSGREKAPCLIAVNAVKRALVQARRPFNSIAAIEQGKIPCSIAVHAVKCVLVQARRPVNSFAKSLATIRQGKSPLPDCRQCCQTCARASTAPI